MNKLIYGCLLILAGIILSGGGMYFIHAGWKEIIKSSDKKLIFYYKPARENAEEFIQSPPAREYSFYKSIYPIKMENNGYIQIKVTAPYASIDRISVKEAQADGTYKEVLLEFDPKNLGLTEDEWSWTHDQNWHITEENRIEGISIKEHGRVHTDQNSSYDIMNPGPPMSAKDGWTLKDK